MACPTSDFNACDFGQHLVNQAPEFDKVLMEDIRVTDNWIGNFTLGQAPMFIQAEIVQDRLRHVAANTTKKWERVVPQGIGCVGNPCDPVAHEIGLGADRLAYYPEKISYRSPLFCFDQFVHLSHAKEHLRFYIESILRPAIKDIGSAWARKKALLWSKKKMKANRNLDEFTFEWGLGGVNGDEEIYFDTSAAPTEVFRLVPQMLQNRFEPLMLKGYGGHNPFRDAAQFIELVTGLDTTWSLSRLGGQQGFGVANVPSTENNWRFTQWSDANQYWKYGFSGQIGNFLVRTDTQEMRFNFVGDLGEGAGANRYRYQLVEPYRNVITTGAGGAAGLGSEDNPDYQRAQFAFTFISHKKALEFLVQDMSPVSPEMPFVSRNLGGKWFFAMNDLGPDANGAPIANPRKNKGLFLADLQYWARPMHYEFLEVFFHKREQFCIPEIDVCSEDPGYPEQNYNSALPECPLEGFEGTYNTGVPTSEQAGPLA